MLRRHWPLLLLLLAPLVPLWRAVFLGETIGPVDQIAHMAPWNGPAPSQPWDVVQADGVLQFLPWRDLVLKSWSHAQLPAWNPYELAGTPLLANSQSGALYPPHILAGLLHLPTPLALALLAWLHLALAGFGAAALCRRLGGSEIGGLIAGLSFVLSAFMLSWVALPSVMETVSWIPWALVAVAAILDGDGTRYRMRSAVGLAASVAMMALAGHLQFVAYGAMAIVVFSLGRLVAHRPKTPLKAGLVGLGLCAGGLLIGFGLAAPQLLPVLQYSQSSHRRNVPSEDGYEGYAASSVHLWEMGGFMFPKLNGDPTANVSITNLGDVPAYWPAYIRRGANFAESAIGIGPLVMCLLMCARRKASYWRELSPLIFVGGLALLLALGSPLGRLLYFYLPGWSATGSPGRAEFLVLLAACVAAGVVASQPIEEREKKRRAFAPLAAFGALTIASIYAVLFGLRGLQSAVPSFDPGTLSTIIAASTKAPMMEAILAAAITAAALGVWIQSGRKATLWLLAPIAISPILILPPLVRSGKADLSVQGPAQGRIAVINNAWDLFMIPPATMPGNLASLSRVHELAGYDSLLDKDSKGVLDDVDGRNSTPPENGNMLFVKPSADPQKLAAAGVEELWSTREIPGLTASGGSSDGLFKYPVPGPGRVSLPNGKAEIVDETLSAIHISATGPGTLTLRDRNMPGWTATIDGSAATIKSDVWREMDVPAGTHSIEMNYTPPGYAIGLKVFMFCILLSGIGLFLGLRRPSSATDSLVATSPAEA